MKTLEELDALHAAAFPGVWCTGTRGECATVYVTSVPPMRAVVTFAEVSNDDNAHAMAALHNNWPAFSARLRAAEAEVERLRGLVRWFLDGDDHTHVDDCGARGQHDRDVCRVAGCGDAECEGPHCTCDATEMRDAARAALGEP